MPGYDGWTEAARSIDAVQADGVSTLIAVVLGLTVAVGAVAILNILSLDTIETARRRPEMALRIAVGARPRHLAGHMLRWRIPLLAAGLLLGIVAAGAFVLGVGAVPSAHGPPEAVVLGPTLLLTGAVAAGVLVLAIPMCSLLRPEGRRLAGRFRGGGMDAPDRHEATWHGFIVVLQVGAACALVVATALFLRGAHTTDLASDLPFARDTVVVSYALPDGLPASERSALHAAIGQGARDLPAVTAASVASEGAWLGLGAEDGVVGMGLSFLNPIQRAISRHLLIDEHFFQAAGLALDRGSAPPGMVPEGDLKPVAINRSAARRLFLGADPIGKELRLGRMAGPVYQVVGIAPDLRATTAGTGWEGMPAVYLPIEAHPPERAGLLVRGIEDPAAAEEVVVPLLLRTAPGATVERIETVFAAQGRAAAPIRWLGRIALVLAAATLVLALLGVHAVIGDLVRRLHAEIGLRQALGATRRHILSMVSRRVAKLGLAGVVLGTAGALALGRLVQFIQFGVPMYDPGIHAAAIALVAVTVVAAAWRPAVQAADVVPAVALRGGAG